MNTKIVFPVIQMFFLKFAIRPFKVLTLTTLGFFNIK